MQSFKLANDSGPGSFCNVTARQVSRRSPMGYRDQVVAGIHTVHDISPFACMTPVRSGSGQVFRTRRLLYDYVPTLFDSFLRDRWAHPIASPVVGLQPQNDANLVSRLLGSYSRKACTRRDIDTVTVFKRLRSFIGHLFLPPADPIVPRRSAMRKELSN